MTNYEFLKNLSVDEMAAWFNEEHVAAKIVRCADCAEWDTSWTPDYDLSGDIHYCPIIDQMTCGNFYCANGEKK